MNKKEALYELAKRRARQNFFSFCLFMNYDFFTKRKFLKEICDALNEAWYSEEKRVRLNYAVPRRSGKTYTTNLFIAWSLGKEYKREVIRASYSTTQSVKENRAVMLLMQTPKFKELFPNMPKLEIDTQEAKQFGDHYRPSLTATSVQTGATGSGCSIMIGDDLYKGFEDAMSERINERTINSYFTTLSSSLDGDRQIEIIIGTRWRIGELADRLDDINYFDHSFKIKAITEDGKSFCDDVKTIEELEEERLKIGDMAFATMYQQEPMLSEDSLFELGDFQYFNAESMPPFITRFAVIDPKSTGKDRFAVGIFRVCQERAILEDAIYTKEVLSNELIQKIANVINHYDCSYTFIEVNKEYSLYLSLKEKLNNKIEEFFTMQNKEVKILVNQMHVKQIGLRTDGDKEYKEFINEMFAFDTKKMGRQIDDATDCMTMACIKMRENKRKLGVTWQ